MMKKLYKILLVSVVSLFNQSYLKAALKTTTSIDSEAKRIVLIKDVAAQSNALKALLVTASANASIVTVNAKTDIFLALQNIFSKALQTTQKLTEVSALLNEWAISNVLTTAQVVAIKGWISSIASMIADIQLKNRVGALASIRDMGTLLTELTQMRKDSIGKKLDQNIQNNVITALQRLFNARQKDVTSLQRLQTLFTDWLNSNLLNQTQNGLISSQWLPTLTVAIQGQVTQQGTAQVAAATATSSIPTSNQMQVSASTQGLALQDAAIVFGMNLICQLQDQIAQLDGCIVIFNNLSSMQSVSIDVANAFMQAIQNIVVSVNTQDAGIQKRAYDLLQASMRVTFLTDAQKMLIKTVLLPKIGTPAAGVSVLGAIALNLTVLELIDAALGQPDFDGQLKMLTIIVKAIGQHPPVIASQNSFAKVIETVTKDVAKRSASQIRALSTFLTSALGSNLLTQDQKNYMATVILPPIGLSRAAVDLKKFPIVNYALPLVQIIKEVASGSVQTIKIDALKYVMALLDGCKLDATVINTLAMAIQQIFDATDLQNFVLRQKIHAMLQQTQGSSVLTDDQQKYVLQSLLAKINQSAVTPSAEVVSAIIALTDPLEQIRELQYMVKGTDIPMVNEGIQAHIANLLEAIGSHVQSLGAAVVSSFITLLESMRTGFLLNKTQQATIDTTLLPMAKEALTELGGTYVESNTASKAVQQHMTKDSVDIRAKATRRKA